MQVCSDDSGGRVDMRGGTFLNKGLCYSARDSNNNKYLQKEASIKQNLEGMEKQHSLSHGGMGQRLLGDSFSPQLPFVYLGEQETAKRSGIWATSGLNYSSEITLKYMLT